MKPSDVQKNRSEFYLRVEEIAKNSGLQESIELVESYKGKVNPRIVLHASMIAFRASNSDRRLEVNFLKDWAQQNPNDLYICLALANALFAVGDLNEARDMLVEFHSRRGFSEFLERSFSLLLNMGFYSEAKNFFTETMATTNISTLPSSFTDVISARIEKSLLPAEQSEREKRKLNLLYINLDRDNRKRKVLEAVYDKIGFKVSRMPGVLGASLPKSLRNFADPAGIFTNSLGSLGCAISHVKAWEVAANNDGYTLVLEDDGLPFYGFLNDVDRVLEDFSDRDILFVNERMSSFRGAQVVKSGFLETVSRLKNLPDSQSGWGGDGYILSNTGANKLLEAFELDRICGHLDGQLGSYGVDSGTLGESKALKVALMCRKRFRSNLVLNSYTLNFPFVHQVNFGFSSRVSY